MVDGKKTDWNDVLLKKGVQEIKNQVFNKNTFTPKINELDSLDKKDIEKIKIDSFFKSENIDIYSIPEINKNSNIDKNEKLLENSSLQNKFNKISSSPPINIQKNIEKELDL